MSFARFRAFRDPNVLPTDCQFHASLNRANAPGQAVTDPPLRGGLARWRLGKRSQPPPLREGLARRRLGKQSQTPHYVGGLRDGAPVDARQAGGIIGL